MWTHFKNNMAAYWADWRRENKSGSNTKISGRILNNLRGHFLHNSSQSQRCFTLGSTFLPTLQNDISQITTVIRMCWLRRPASGSFGNFPPKRHFTNHDVPNRHFTNHDVPHRHFTNHDVPNRHFTNHDGDPDVLATSARQRELWEFPAKTTFHKSRRSKPTFYKSRRSTPTFYKSRRSKPTFYKSRR